MVKSMTAYGRSLRHSSLGKWLIEVHSVNKRSLDFNVLISKDLFQFDLEIRKKIALFFKRGQVTVKVSLYPSETCFDLTQHEEPLRLMKEGMEKVCEKIGCSFEGITFPFLYEEMKASSCSSLLRERETVKEELMLGIEEALSACAKMKEAEGSALSEAFKVHSASLKNFLCEVQGKVEGLEGRYRKKILDKLQDFKEITAEDKDRVLREVFFYTEKADITLIKGVDCCIRSKKPDYLVTLNRRKYFRCIIHPVQNVSQKKCILHSGKHSNIVCCISVQFSAQFVCPSKNISTTDNDSYPKSLITNFLYSIC